MVFSPAPNQIQIHRFLLLFKEKKTWKLLHFKKYEVCT